jgi:hypothetical protein
MAGCSFTICGIGVSPLNIGSCASRAAAPPSPPRSSGPDRSRVPRPPHDRIDDRSITADLKTSVNHLNALITSLRDLGRPRAAAEDIPVIDPFPIVRHAMSVCQELALRGCASIGYHGPRELPRIRMLPTELTQVLINVVANGTQAVAARGTPNGRRHPREQRQQPPRQAQIRDDGGVSGPGRPRPLGTPFFDARRWRRLSSQCQRLISTAGINHR